MPCDEFDIDRPSVMAAVVPIAAVISAFLLVAPAVVGALVNTIGLPPARAGYLLSIELAAMGVVVPPAFWWMARWDWRRVTVACLVLVAIGNAASACAHSFLALAILRSLTGIGAGSVILVCSATVAMTRERERNYGFYVVGQLVLGVLGVKFLPGLIARHGLIALYGTLALGTLALVPLVGCLPRSGRPEPGSRTGRGAGVVQWIDGRAFMGLGGILCFYIALSAVWAYLERIGTRAGFQRETIADALALASLFGVGGSIAASLLGGRWGRTAPICLGYAILIGALASLFSVDGSVSAYTLGSCAFKFAWTFALPFVLASLAARDPTGRVIVAANLLIIVGLAAGPALAALSLHRAPDYSGTLLIGVSLAILSLILALPMAYRGRGAAEPASSTAP
ncbi:MAG TPA: MFS transporter [Steroidobacteraceae bacterium]|nr:MFS transporter [Steroidobacteraceae bacterium]